MSGMSEVPDGWEPPLVVQPSAPAGSVLVYNGHCWHAGGANTSDIYRCSCFGHYRKSLEAYPAFGGRIFQCDPAAGFPADWWDDLTQRQKELMGMTAGPGGPPAGQLTAHDHSSCHFLSLSLSLSPSLARSLALCVFCVCVCVCVCVCLSICACVCVEGGGARVYGEGIVCSPLSSINLHMSGSVTCPLTFAICLLGRALGKV